MTRVLYLTTGEGLGDGLIASQVDRLLDARARCGDEILWVALVPVHKLVRQTVPLGSKAYRRIIIPIPSRNLWIDVSTVERHAKAVGRLIRTLAGHNWDVIHCRSYPAGLLGLRIRDCMKGARLVFDPRGIYPEEAEISGPGRVRPEFVTTWSAAEAELLNRADGVVCVSDRMRLHFESKHPASTAHKWVVPCSGGSRHFVPPRASDSSGPVRICYCGSIGTWTGASDIADMFAPLASVLGDVQLTVIGDGDPKALWGEIEARGAKVVDVVVTRVSQERVFDLLCKQTLGLLPRSDSLANRVSWPAKLSEYLMAGLPVAANLAESNIAEVLTRHEALVLVENDRLYIQDGVSLGSDTVRADRAMRAGRSMSVDAVAHVMGSVWTS